MKSFQPCQKPLPILSNSPTPTNQHKLQTTSEKKCRLVWPVLQVYHVRHHYDRYWRRCVDNNNNYNKIQHIWLKPAAEQNPTTASGFGCGGVSKCCSSWRAMPPWRWWKKCFVPVFELTSWFDLLVGTIFKL